MKKQFLYLLSLLLIVIVSCQKELSFEQGDSPGKGTLQSNVTGDCLPKTVNGSYGVGIPLIPTSNTITVQVNITKTGTYVITTDTVNGYYFRATGTFTTLGLTTITLRGNGTPFATGVNNFVVSFDGSVCDIQVTVASPAVFTLAGAPNACTGAVVAGSYALGIPLTATNTATISVNVTTIGAYTISTTYQGMTFQKSGTFATTGVQTVVLDGSGTPTTAGINKVPVTAGASTCSFDVNVGNPGTGTLGGAPGACTPSTVFGIYMQNTALDVTDSVRVTVTVTTAGVCSISTNTVSGFSFSFTGNLAVGTQTIVLAGTGTPTTTGAQVFTVTFGTSSCNFTVTVVPVDYFPRTTNSNWSYETNDVSTDSVYRVVNASTISALGNTFNIFLQNDGTGLDSSGYYRKAANDYYEWFDVGGYIGFDPPAKWVEYVMLKDNQPVGTNWKSAAFAGTITAPPSPPQSLTVRFSYTIAQKDVSVSLTTSTGTVNYSNVIVVDEKFDILTPPSTWTDATSIVGYTKSYYARGIGLIKFEVYDPSGTLTDFQKLRRYQVF